MEQKIRVLLADDDSEFCARMAAAIEKSNDMELAGIAEDGAKAVAAVGELKPDLLIIDLVLPVMDGIMVLTKLHERRQEQPATVTQNPDGTVHVSFDEPQRAIARGQAVVLYDGDTVVGGGTIL